MLFRYAFKIFEKPRNKPYSYIILALVNSFFIAIFDYNVFSYHFLFIFLLLILTLEFKLLAKATWSQIFFGSTIFTFHIASVNLPVIVSLSRILEIPPYEILLIDAYRDLLVSISIFILLFALFIVNKIFNTKDIKRLSTTRPFADIITLTTLFIVLYLSFDSYTLITENYFDEQLVLIFSIITTSLVVFYYILYSNIQFINLSVYKRKSDELEIAYNKLTSEKDAIANKLLLDNLTKLYNRKFIYNTIEELSVQKDMNFSIIFVDINALKYVNDIFGHDIGDYYIKTVANCISEGIRAQDLAARIGGDEFIIVLVDQGESIIEKIINRIENNLANLDPIKNFRPSVSMGGIFVDSQMKQYGIKHILDEADKVMRNNKQSFYSKRKEKK